MANNKASFLLYRDIIHTVEKLDDQKAGELFKHILRYVNDLSPHTDDMVLELVFEPIRQSLKRDLKKYIAICDRNKVNGSKGGRPKKPKKPSGLKNNPKNPDEPKKPDSDIDSDIDIEIKGVIYPFDDAEFLKTWKIWKQYKKEQHKFIYKGKASEQGALTKLNKLAKTSKQAREIIWQSIEQGWKGFFELRKDQSIETTIYNTTKPYHQ